MCNFPLSLPLQSTLFNLRFIFSRLSPVCCKNKGQRSSSHRSWSIVALSSIAYLISYTPCQLKSTAPPPLSNHYLYSSPYPAFSLRGNYRSFWQTFCSWLSFESRFPFHPGGSSQIDFPLRRTKLRCCNRAELRTNLAADVFYKGQRGCVATSS